MSGSRPMAWAEAGDAALLTELYELTRDVCVAWTAEDAAERGFETYVLWDLTRPVDPRGDAALRARLGERGVVVVDRAELEADPRSP